MFQIRRQVLNHLSGNLGFEKLHFAIILNAYLKKKKRLWGWEILV